MLMDDVGRKRCYGIMNGLSKNALMMDLFICLFTYSFSLHKTLTDGQALCGLLVRLLVTLILTAPIHSRRFIGEQIM